MKTTASIVALVIAVTISPAAQTLTEQLQKGIYTEETLKNKTEAVRIYRQILAAPSVPDAISTEAQRRLARLLLTSQASPPPSALNQEPSSIGQARGVVEQGRYRHIASGITFDLPPGWSAGETYGSSDDGDMVTVTDGTRGIHVWLIKETTPADRVAARVAEAPAEKVRQRHSGYGIPGMPDANTYDIPAETLRPMSINGRHAMAAIGSYVGFPIELLRRPDGSIDPFQRPGELYPMREYMTWIYTQQSRAFFFARVLAEDVPDLRPVFEQIVNSAMIP
jgi:hypothetical protein